MKMRKHKHVKQFYWLRKVTHRDGYTVSNHRAYWNGKICWRS